MKCPKCGNREGINAIKTIGARGLIPYQLECTKCSTHWTDSKPSRVGPINREEKLKKIKEKWANVTYISIQEIYNKLKENND